MGIARARITAKAAEGVGQRQIGVNSRYLPGRKVEWTAKLLDVGRWADPTSENNPYFVGEGILEIRRHGNGWQRLTGLGDSATITRLEVSRDALCQGVAGALAHCALSLLRGHTSVLYTPSTEAARAWSEKIGMSSAPSMTGTYIGRAGAMMELLEEDNPRIRTAEKLGGFAAMLEDSQHADLDRSTAMTAYHPVMPPSENP